MHSTLKPTGIFPLRQPGSQADEVMVAYTAESPVGSFVFRMKFPASVPREHASALAKKKIAAVCRSIARAAETA